MANECENYLYVFSNNEEQLNLFMEDAIDVKEYEDLSLEKLFPMPHEPDEEDENDLTIEEWREVNWGVSDIYKSRLTYASNLLLHYFFISHNVPPTEWVRNVAPLYPELRFFMKYKEDGCGLFGGCMAKNDNFVNAELDDFELMMIFNSNMDKRFQLSTNELFIFSEGCQN